ncbi:hypothetical protein KTR66_05405 [Roseococcus sp. SDR]|uniref:phage tail protein n=1 Tax=Roseococcus sp. SDR TaxID=2835532 RepID=UPI001BD0EDB4|nr:phage tail protein [Roseococcus sp. SDR]MBS7789419.1 hypothetical protein [Roseococcus sp. SDR]MBV1844733.1 hypothetical protein [Roseococcus sp. SDR]
MPAAIPIIAVVAGAVGSAAVGGGVIGALVGAGAAIAVSFIGSQVFPQNTATARGSSASFNDSGAGGTTTTAVEAQARTQSFRQAITEHALVFGRCKVSGPIVFVHSSTDDEGRADGYFHAVVVLAAHRVRTIGEVWLGDALATDPKFSGLVRIDRHLGDPGQAANANLIAETGGKWTAAHRGAGRAYMALRLKITPEAFPSGPPNMAALVEGADTIRDPRSGAIGWSDNPALCLAWYLTAPFGWRASWDEIDMPALIAAANICDEIMGRRDGTAERRYTVNGRVSLGEGKIAITRKLLAAMAGTMVVSGGRFVIHAGAPALPAATLTAADLRGDVSVMGSRLRRDLFNGVRAVYVDPGKNWQPTDAPPLLASNYVTEDGGEAIYRDLDFPLTTSAATVQRLMKVELERNRRQRAVVVQANLSALRLRPWDGVMVAIDRIEPFPARITGWRFAPEGGIDLTLAEEDAAVWDWNPAVDERATGDSPSVILPRPGSIATPASIRVGTPSTATFAALGVDWAAVPSAYLAGYEVEARPASVANWLAVAAGTGALFAVFPTTEPTAFRVRARARSGAVSGWQEAAIPAAPSGLAAVGVVGGIQITGAYPAGATALQVFEATSNSLAAAVLQATITTLPWTRTGLATGQARWLWLRSVSPEGNVSALVGPVTATAL